MRSSTFVALLIALFTLAIYSYTLAPTVTFVDSGELIVAAKALGVAHPPGFPLYVLLAHVATLVPIANVAARVNFASALFAAVAVAFVFLFACEITRNLKLRDAEPRSIKKKSRRQDTKYKQEVTRPISGLAMIPAIVAALAFAFSRTLWSFATVAEVYTLNTLIIATICFLMYRWRATEDARFIYLAALLFGLGLGVHHVTIGVMLPALAVLVYRCAGWSFFKSKRLLFAALISIFGLLIVYSYLPLAARRSPLMNWGDPQTAQRLWWHVTGHQYQVFFSFSLEQIVNQSAQFASLAAREFNPVWLPLVLLLALFGFIELYQFERTTFWYLVLIVITDLAYSLNYEIAEDKGAYYLPTFLCLAVATGFGTQVLFRFILAGAKTENLRTAAAIVMTILVPATTFAGNFAYTNRHNFYLASDYIENIERPLPANSLLLTSDWQVYSPLFYLREVENRRRDVTAIDINLLRRSWYFEYLQNQYPELMRKTNDTVQPFLDDLRRWEQDPELFARSPNLTRQINDHFHQMIMAFVESQQQRAPVFVTSEIGTGATDQELTQLVTKANRLVPEGLVFRLSSPEDFANAADPELVIRRLNDGSFTFTEDDVITVKVISTYTSMLINRGRYCESLGRIPEAIASYRKALEIDPSSRVARESLTRLSTANTNPFSP